MKKDKKNSENMPEKEIKSKFIAIPESPKDNSNKKQNDMQDFLSKQFSNAQKNNDEPSSVGQFIPDFKEFDIPNGKMYTSSWSTEMSPDEFTDFLMSMGKMPPSRSKKHLDIAEDEDNATHRNNLESVLNIKDETNFNNGLCMVHRESDDKWAFMNTNGKIKSRWYDKISPFNGNYAIVTQFVTDETGTFTENAIIDRDGVIMPLCGVKWNDKIFWIKGNYVARSLGHRFDLIYIPTGNPITAYPLHDIIYLKVINPNADKKYDNMVILYDGKKYALANLNIDENPFLIGFELDGYDAISNDFISLYKKDKGWAYFNLVTKRFCGGWFSHIAPFNEGYGIVEQQIVIDNNTKQTNVMYSFIDQNGEYLVKTNSGVPLFFDWVTNFSKDGYARVEINEYGFTFIDTMGHFILTNDQDKPKWFKF